MEKDIPVDISIIIVNWNSRSYLEKCLETVYRDGGTLAVEVIVVDNASYDGSETMVQERFPRTTFVQNRVNAGFSGANNLAFRFSRGKSLLFLNPDTEIINDAVDTMHRLLWQLDDAGALGCMLLNTDGTIQSSCIQSFPTILNQVLDSEALRRRFPDLSFWGMGPLFEESDAPEPVDVVSGACLMVKRTVFESIGLFSDDYFMYAEDADLCYRMRSAGYPAYYTSAAAVIHHGGGCCKRNGHSLRSVVIMCESLFRFMTNHYGALYGLAYRAALFSASLCRMAVLALLRLGARSGDGAQGASLVAAFEKWRRILTWAIGLEGWARRRPRTAGNDAVAPL